MITKYFFFIMLCAWLGTSSLQVFARTTSYTEANLVAEKHLQRHGKSSGFSLNEGRLILSKDVVIAYLFDLDPQGYIVIAGSDLISPVIAYSFESDFGTMDQGNPLFQLIKADLAYRIQYSTCLQNGSDNINVSLWEEMLSGDFKAINDLLFEQWPATGDGWLKTNWTQNPPYSNFCPLDPVTGLRSYAGCPATAMAQIMNFHETTNSTHFDDADDYYHNYAGRQYWIDDDYDFADFPSFPELNTYLDTLNAHYLAEKALTNDDKAAMTFACGVAARQVFTSQGSGTFGVDQAYDAYLRFGCSTVELLDSTDADLYERMKQNIKDTLPVHLAVVDESWSTGHNVVVDGYNTDDYYHLNFGWGGSFNGWYLLPEEIPYELTVIEGVVVDILKRDITGIEKTDLPAFETRVSPNPVYDYASISFTTDYKSSITLRLFNSSGVELYKYEYLDQAPGNHSFPLTLKEQPAGIYFYLLKAGNSCGSGKIIVSH
jgi:hypothetical protein